MEEIILQIKYYCLRAICVLLSPLLIFEGKRVRKNVPSLPEAEIPFGIENSGLDPSLNLLVLGESTMAGVGVKTHQEGFAGSLAREMHKTTKRKVNWKVIAHTGYTAEKIHLRLIPKIERSNWDLIIIGTGANDAFSFSSLSKWEKDIQLIISKLRTKLNAEIPILFINMPPISYFPAMPLILKVTIGKLVNIFGTKLEHLIQQSEACYYNSEKMNPNNFFRKYNLENDLSTFFSDGIHPSKKTYQLWAKETNAYIFDHKIIEG